MDNFQTHVFQEMWRDSSPSKQEKKKHPEEVYLILIYSDVFHGKPLYFPNPNHQILKAKSKQSMRESLN